MLCGDRADSIFVLCSSRGHAQPYHTLEGGRAGASMLRSQFSLVRWISSLDCSRMLRIPRTRGRAHSATLNLPSGPVGCPTVISPHAQPSVIAMSENREQGTPDLSPVTVTSHLKVRRPVRSPWLRMQSPHLSRRDRPCTGRCPTRPQDPDCAEICSSARRRLALCFRTRSPLPPLLIHFASALGLPRCKSPKRAFPRSKSPRPGLEVGARPC